ncbi:FHA domain-containing protein [Oerskovia turbata]|uniref:FHA domain-containing protein n=1 Tax=Oerskovia turbata TaxID=1713 RepID=A0A4Q1KPE6_9CELL|nr:FHA domain-containing protein [Oerskovia turbata]RXR21757.1 FHA domain-containing protein [Oerskovia turbata]RXR31445.1 FHA domain-containing protein [Oerskovia turbata]TGJ95954.1 FHA domain-containing protein [Actinotalea fermentans ATCC 43279 = JCM 9966 = DSM 3133]
MTELTFTLLRLGFLVLLWVFVFAAIGVLRRDLYGTKITARKGRGTQETHPTTGATPSRGSAPSRGAAASGPTPAAPAPTGPTRLVVTAGPLRGTTVPLSASSILLGRAPSCTLVLDDDYSSSRHARIFPQGGSWYVEDLGSTNGTYIDDRRITGIEALPPGVGVRVGQSIVELQR